ncbi:hypothetical protein FRC00_000852, partial [Tulasnella sp. 408]
MPLLTVAATQAAKSPASGSATINVAATVTVRDTSQPSLIFNVLVLRPSLLVTVIDTPAAEGKLQNLGEASSREYRSGGSSDGGLTRRSTIHPSTLSSQQVIIDLGMMAPLNSDERTLASALPSARRSPSTSSGPSRSGPRPGFDLVQPLPSAHTPFFHRFHLRCFAARTIMTLSGLWTQKVFPKEKRQEPSPPSHVSKTRWTHLKSSLPHRRGKETTGPATPRDAKVFAE